MRIAMAARDARSLSGVSTVLRELAAGAARAGHDVRLLSHRPPPNGAGRNFGGTLKAHRVAMLPLHSTLRAWSFDLAVRLAARTLGSDIVHGHGDLTTQDVLTVNNVDAAEAHFTGRTKVGSSGTQFVRERQFRPGAARRIVTVSERAKRDVARFYGVPAERVEVIYLGVDSSRFTPEGRQGERLRLRASLGLPAKTRLILSLISGDPERRNVDGLLAAFAAAKLGAGDALLLVGDPAASSRPGAKALQAQGRLKLLPKTSEPERVYRGCDAFILPAHYETFGMTALEAMASGLPTAVTAMCGASELIEDGRNGLVIADSRDRAALAGALERLAACPLDGPLAAAGLATARSRSWAATVEGYLDLYDRVLREKRA